MEKYSFLTSIYRNTKVDEMKVCIQSMINQSFVPEQIVIVIDGAIDGDLKGYIHLLKESDSELYTIVPLENNVGLGLALREGMTHCRNELIARMDTDDICTLDRCEKQLKCFELDDDLSIVGSNIAEFENNVDNVVSYRNVPVSHDEICEYLKSRCPLNHMTVMFKKSKVEEAGGYLAWHYNEDSYLWARMYLVGAKFLNIMENLVFARIDTTTFKRRGGYTYYKSERDLFKFMRKNKIINWMGYLKAKYIRMIVQVLMPNFVREWFFKKFARN